MIHFLENVPLAQFSSFKIGGPARYFFEAKSEAELIQALENKIAQIFILGGGTNLLISDEGFPGLVIKPAINFLNQDKTEIEAGAGVLMSELINFTANAGLSGLEWAGGLPGTVGGAIRGNAGAFEGEIKDVILGVRSLDIVERKVHERDNQACKFNYRNSIFKELHGEEVIISARFKFTPGDPASVREAAQSKIDYRNERHPMDYPNIGSIFKNVSLATITPELRPRIEGSIKKDPFPVVPAAFLISEAGVKSLRHGDAMVSPKHPNFIVNCGKATARDVLFLIKQVKNAVLNEFNLQLEEEVQGVGITYPQV